MTKAEVTKSLRKEALDFWFEKAVIGYDRKPARTMDALPTLIAATAFEAGWDAGAQISAIEVTAMRIVLKDCATALHADRAHPGEFKDCDRFGCYSALQRLG